MTPLRSLPGYGFGLGIRSDLSLTLLLVPADGREPAFANTAPEKDALIAARQPGDLLVLAWTRALATEMYRVTDADLELHYRRARSVGS